MIKAIVFDLDGMVYIVEELFSTHFSREFNVPLEEILEFFKKDFHTCQENKVDMKEALKKYLQKWKWTQGVDKLLKYWYEEGGLNKEMINIIKKLRKRGIICILCTNNEKYRMNYIKKKYKIDEIFDYIITSCDIGVRKPNKRMLDKILEITKLRQEEIVFFDDKQEVVDAIKELGFVSLIYKDMDDFKKKLGVLGIKI